MTVGGVLDLEVVADEDVGLGHEGRLGGGVEGELEPFRVVVEGEAGLGRGR